MNPLALEFDGKHVRFANDSPICEKRVRSFLTKEPDTVEWIKTLPKETVLWDIGANIGIYAIPAATRVSKVVAFEPMLANYTTLAKNVALNPDANILPIHAALSDKTGVALLDVPDATPGAAMTSVSMLGYKGEVPSFKNCEPVLTMTGRDFYAFFDSERPTAIKLDVDGLEHLILPHLVMDRVQTAIIEVDSSQPHVHAEILHFMSRHSFSYDRAQEQRSRRVGGPNDGVGNIIFRR